jgi:4-oxalocrotonate tautomerase/trans-3-chloroacrylic acid dehalogenase beta subunit
MPFVQCHIATGLSDDRKRQLIRDIVAATHQAIGSSPDTVNVVVHEYPRTNLSMSNYINESAKGSAGAG